MANEFRDRRICSAQFRAEDCFAVAPKRRLRYDVVPCLRDSARLATAMESITSVPQILALADPPVSEGEEEIVASSTSGNGPLLPHLKSQRHLGNDKCMILRQNHQPQALSLAYKMVGFLNPLFVDGDGKSACTKVKEAWCRNIGAVSSW